MDGRDDETTETRQWLLGDFSGDGLIGIDDVTACALAWNDRPGYFIQYPSLSPDDLLSAGDFNDDGDFNSLDIEPFKSFIIAELTAQRRAAEADNDPVDESDPGGVFSERGDDALRPRLTIVDAPYFPRTSKTQGTGGAIIQASSNSGGGGGGGGGSTSGGGGGGGGGGGVSAGGSGGGNSGVSSEPAALYPSVTGLAGASEDAEPSLIDTGSPVVDLRPNSASAILDNPTAAELGLPAGPAGVDAPGAISIGTLDLRNLATAPAISEISDVTLPGETLVMTGRRLTGANLRLWSPGGNAELSPLRADDMTLQAILPQLRYIRGARVPVSHSTVLVAPVRGGKMGLPIRVNAATAWWSWPCRAYADRAGQTVRLIGKNLSLPGQAPLVYMQRGGRVPVMLEVTSSTPYTIEARLPERLPAGSYRLWAHNSTGGAYGWSEPTTFEVVDKELRPATTVIADNYLLDGMTDREAIQQAIHAAQIAGGGTVHLGPRTYVINKPLHVSNGPAVKIRGTGTGQWDPRLGVVLDPTGTATVLHSPPGAISDTVVNLFANGSVIEDLTVLCEEESMRSGIRLRGEDQTLRRVQVIRTGQAEYNACIQSIYPGPANHVIDSCILYGVSTCIWISKDTDYVRITDCVLRGAYSAGPAYSANAVLNVGGDNMILEGCDARSVDWANGKILGRTCLLYDSSISNTYIANNHSEDIGPHPSVPGIDGNTGEQYLFHYRGEQGGLYSVTEAGEDWVGVRGGLPSQVDASSDWTVFLARGEGAGQWRTIVGFTPAGAALLDRPWRIKPGLGATAIVQKAFRRNIVYGNTIVGPTLEAGVTDQMKTVGIYWYQNSYENIAANNELKHIAVGTAISAEYNRPSAWNLIRDNVMQDLGGHPGGTASVPMAYVEVNIGTVASNRKKIRHWITVGNIFRGNRVTGAPAAASLGWWLFNQRYDREHHPSPDVGMVMSVIENNTFERVERGILLSSPANRALLRNNDVSLTGNSAGVIEVPNPSSLYEPWLQTNYTTSYD